jgi:hypothetical protein
MFCIRPIARDDLASILALSERTGSGLTTLPANRERLEARIERSLASFASTAPRADACYMFVLVEGGAGAATERVVGISAIEAAVGLNEPWYNYHVGTLVHASRALDVYTVAPTLFLSNGRRCVLNQQLDIGELVRIISGVDQRGFEHAVIADACCAGDTLGGEQQNCHQDPGGSKSGEPLLHVISPLGVQLI